MIFDKPKLIIIAGPTAVGKTSYAIDLAKKINGEIISADSMQIFKELEIGTAKPTKQEQREVKHHMIDFLEPDKDYSVYQYRQDAGYAIKDILSKTKVPIVCGGTGLYIHSLIYDMDFQSGEKRNKSRNEYLDYSADELGDLLISKGVTLKPDDKGNIRRMARMLEILEETGTLSTFEKSQKESSEYISEIIILDRERTKLYDRINSRVDIMLEMGLVDEVKSLLDKGLSPEAQSMQAIGYREVISYLREEISLYEMTELIKKNSRNYAKRQLTWFRRYKNAKWVNL